MDLEPILRHNAAEPLKIGFNHSNKHRQPPTEKQKEALIHWARGCIVLIDAALAFGKTGELSHFMLLLRKLDYLSMQSNRPRCW